MPVKKRSARAKQRATGAVETDEDGKRAQPAQSATVKGKSGRERGAIGREEILGKYWELANLDPEVTKGNITGQLKALDSLCQELGLGPAERKSQEPKHHQEIYRSAWLRAAGNKTANE